MQPNMSDDPKQTLHCLLGSKSQYQGRSRRRLRASQLILSSSARGVSVRASSAAARFLCRWPHLHWGRPKPCCDLRESRGLERREAAKWKKRHIGDAAARQFIDQGVVIAMHEIITVLHADDLGDTVRLFELGRGHVAQAELSDQALPLGLSEGCKLFLDRALDRLRNAAHAQVDHIERIHPEIPEIVMNGAREVSGCERGESTRRPSLVPRRP
jgi:hypothetical protein